MMAELAEHHPVLFIVKDLHWTDPNTLELVGLLIEQTPLSHLYVVLTCRPEFESPFGNRLYLTQMTLNRLSESQVEQVATRVAGGKALPSKLIEQLVERTDGVPLYVEEMTKSVLESGVLKESDGQYELTDSISSLAIPSTLQDSLMARLDRLVTAKGVAQYDAVIGRQFSHELLQSVGCHAHIQPLVEDAEHTVIYVVGHGWHTGIVVPLDALSLGQLPVAEHYTQHAFLEVSWGDRDFFQHRTFSIPIALKAALLPTESVLHVVGFSSPVEAFFSKGTIIKLTPSNEGFLELVAFVRSRFSYDPHGSVQDLGPGLYGDSRFYQSRETYYLPKTCNTWTARALRRAGYAISPFNAFNSGCLLKAMEKYGHKVR